MFFSHTFDVLLSTLTPMHFLTVILVASRSGDLYGAVHGGSLSDCHPLQLDFNPEFMMSASHPLCGRIPFPPFLIQTRLA